MADDELLDQDIDQELEPTPFISKSLIGRFLAVGVFVALGTFAVIQSVTPKHDEADQHLDHEHPGVISSVSARVGESVSAVGDKTKKGLDDFLGSAKNVASSTAASVKNAASSTTATVKNKVASVTSGFSMGSKNHLTTRPKPTAPPIKPITRGPLVDPMVKKTPPSFGGSFGGNSLTAKAKPSPRPKPPERLAQNGGFLPTVGNQGLGAAKNTAAAALTKMQINKPLPGFKAAADTSANTFRELKKSIDSGVNSLTRKTNAATKSTVSAGVNKVTEFGNSTRKNLASPLSDRLQARSNSGGFSKPAPVVKPAARPTSFGSSSQQSGNRETSALKRTQQRDLFGDAAESKAVKSPSTRRTLGSSAPKPPGAERKRTQLVSSPRRSFSQPQNERGGSSNKSPVAQLASTARTLGVPGERRLEGVQAPSLTIEKVSPREIQVDQAADFEIRVRNVGRVAADNVMVIDRVPEGTEFLSAEPAPARAQNSSALNWEIGTLAPGQEKRIRYQLKPTKPGEIGSVAQVANTT